MNIHLFITWLLLTVLFGIHAVLVNGLCQIDQQSILAQFHNSLTFNQSKSIKLVSWNLSSDCCDWDGVTCDEGGLGHVIGLNLSNESISGGLENSSALFSLRYLQNLDLSGNNFNTSMPPNFANLTGLISLNLSNAGFIGQIPIEISYLTKLVSLSNLVHINLANNSLNGSIPSSLFAIPSLRQILLSFNQFGGQVPDFSNASSLSLDTLDLSNNNLEGPIPNSVFELGRLKVLRLARNKFNGTIKKLVNLTTVDLSYNKLTMDANDTNSITAFSPRLTALKLVSCSLRAFPDLRNQSNLAYLDLSDNQIVGSVPQWIQQVGNGTIKYLNLSHNHLVSLPEPLSLSDTLYVLDLHKNQLQGKIPTLPPLVSLVDFSDNYFSSSIPLNIGDYLSSTFFFSLSNNSIEGVVPESICKANLLEVLDLSHNNLNGSIPSCLIESLEILGVLNLRKNNFNSSIPDNFPQQCQLQTLDLSGNLLEGKVPRSLINCAMLEVLDLGSNKINDTFPCLLRKISSLRVLVLRNNNFYGNINCPSSNSTWSRLQIVDIASNSFSGKLPNTILSEWKAMIGDGNESHGHIVFNFLPVSGLYYQDSVTVTSKGREMQLVKILSVFTSMDVSCNKFDGQIPEMLGQFNALYVLNLSHNALDGQIPPSLGNESHLESLDLSSNKLTGEIPLQLASLTFLSCLNLSNNDLVGEIPTGRQLQTFENTSYQGNERLCGPPLSKLCSNKISSPPPEFDYIQKRVHANGINWNFMSVELGYIFGFGIIVGPLILWERWRIRYYKHVDRLLVRIFPQLEDRIMNRRRKRRCKIL